MSDQVSGGKATSWVPWLVLGILGVGALVLAYAETADPKMAHDSVLDTLFDDRLLVATARVLIFVLLLYLLASVVVRVRRGQWVRGAGQVQTDAPAQDLVDDQEDLQAQLEEAKATIDDLTQRLDRSLDEHARLRATMVDSPTTRARGDEAGPGVDDDTPTV